MRGWIELLINERQRITLKASAIIGLEEIWEGDGCMVHLPNYRVAVLQSRDEVCAQIEAVFTFETAVGLSQ